MADIALEVNKKHNILNSNELKKQTKGKKKEEKCLRAIAESADMGSLFGSDLQNSYFQTNSSIF